VFSYATKVLGALTVAALVTAGVYYAVEGGRSGAVLLLILSAAAFFGLLTVVASGVDIAPHVPADAPPPERNAHTPGPAATGSAWPVITAGSAVLLAVGVATNEVVVYFGLAAVGLAALGWFSKAWADHPTWTPRVGGRVVDRFVAPLTTPVGTGLLTALIAISLSRPLLATDVAVAPWISLVVAIAILGACAWIAVKPRVTSSAVTAIAVAGAIALVGGGIASAAQGEREYHHKAHVEHPVEITAKDNAFAEQRVEAKVDDHGEVIVDFHNLDHDVFHNVALYEGETPDAPAVFNGQGFPGHEEKTYRIHVEPGRYTFRCDFHANMVGTFVVGGG